MPHSVHHKSLLLTLAVLVCVSAQSWGARVGLVIGEPFGNFGTMMPQGHASVYLPDFCADGPVHLRRCAAGEAGVVLSRYHDLRHSELDWMAVPLIPFLYGVDEVSAVPASVDQREEASLRERYRQAHLLEILPDWHDRHRVPRPPDYGDWAEGIGAAFDRRVLLYTFEVPEATEAAIAAHLNGEQNRRRYTLGRENCADFAAELLSTALPEGTLRRNVLADFDMTTPKNLAREVDAYGAAHPGLQLEVFAIPQLPGTLRRSRPVRGAAEGFVAEKRYVLALSVLQPEALLACLWSYETHGKWTPGTDAIPLAPQETARFLKPSVRPAPLPPVPESPPTASASAQNTRD